LHATLEGSVRQPGVQGRGCCSVRIRLSGELEADRVPWVPLQENAPLLRADDVEGWRNEVADVGHPTGVLWRLLGKANPVRDPIRAIAVQRVVNATEWPDQGHGASLAAGRISQREERRTTNEGGSPASLRRRAVTGNRTTSTVPEPASRFASTRTVPPWPSTMARVMYSPSPSPPNLRCGPSPSAWTNRSKTRSRRPSGIPTPSSATRTSTSSPIRDAWMVTGPPSGEYLTALSTRFVSTWAIRSRSASTGRLAGA